MDKELQNLKENIKAFINKYNINDFDIEIFKLYQNKTIFLSINGEWK